MGYTSWATIVDHGRAAKQRGDTITMSAQRPIQADLRVLAVDDHPVNRAFLRAVLKPQVGALRLANSGIAAIERCTTERFDLILLDLHMPDLDGFSTWQRICEVHPAPLPVAVALTADHREEAMQRARDVGFRGYVGKPVSPDALLATLPRILDGHSVFETAGTSSRNAPALLDDARALRALGSADRLDTMRRTFGDELRDGLDALDRDVLHDASAAGDRLHQWIGAAGYVGAERLAIAATELRQALSQREPDALSAALLKLRRSADATLAAFDVRASGSA